MGGVGAGTGKAGMISSDAIFLAIARLWNIKYNLNLIMRKHKIHKKWRTLYNIPDHYCIKVLKSLRIRKDRTVTD